MSKLVRNSQKIVHAHSVLHGIRTIRFFAALNTQRQLKHRACDTLGCAGTMQIEAIYDPNQPIDQD